VSGANITAWSRRLRLLPMATFFLAAPAMSENVDIDESGIVSLSNAPAVLEASGGVDEAGRPSLYLRLSFANTCLRDTGADIQVAEKAPAGAAVFILQRVPRDGCPDIFQPVESDIRLLLPSTLAGQTVRIVARPLTGNALAEIDLTGSGQTAPAGRIMEAKSLGVDGHLPAIDDISIAPAEGGRGYVISGTIATSQDCAQEQLRATAYEVPDANGEPKSDVIVVSAPPECSEDAGSAPVTIRIGTPQRPDGRQVIVLNAPRNEAIPFGR
jgi:hypothetical protein